MAAVARRPGATQPQPTQPQPTQPFLLRLYPAAWRARYGDEFAELLAARPPALRDRLDILGGAIDARLHPQVGQDTPSSAPIPRDRSVGGLIVLAGVLLSVWAALGVAFLGRWESVDATVQSLSGVSSASGLLGGILIAIALLLVASRYDWSIGSAGAIGGVITGAGLVFSALGGGIGALLLLGGGTALLAWRIRGRLVGTLSAVSLVAATLLLIGAFLAIVANRWTDMTPFWLLVLYGPAWVIVGLDLRAPPRPMVAG